MCRSENGAVILLVEDQVLVRMLAADILEDAGFEVCEATNAEEALAVLESRTDIEVLLTDVNMPGPLDGFALARVAYERWPQISIMTVSGMMQPGPGDLPPEAYFLPKPYHPDTLVRRVREIVELGRSE